MSEFDIEYKLRTTIKSQVLAGFNPGLLPLATKEGVMVSESTSGSWTLFMGRAFNVKGSGLGIVLTMLSRETLRQTIEWFF